jgi:hypothetical protein
MHKYNDNDLVPFPNEAVSTLIEPVSFLRKLVVWLIAQQTIEPRDSRVCIRKEHSKNPPSTHSATNPILTPRVFSADQF